MFDTFLAQLPRFATWETAGYFYHAMITTMKMTLIGCVIGFVCAFILVFLRTTPGWVYLPLRLTMIAFAEFFRRVPFLVLLFLVLFIAKGFGFTFSFFIIACISVVITSTAFISEIVRAGLESVQPTQWEAASAMNFGRLQTLAYVILPQAWKVILPAAFSFFVMFIKDSSLASQIGVIELTAVGRYFNNIGTSALLSFGTVLVLYFILSYPMTRLGWWMEERVERGPAERRSDVPLQAAYQRIPS